MYNHCTFLWKTYPTDIVEGFGKLSLLNLHMLIFRSDIKADKWINLSADCRVVKPLSNIQRKNLADIIYALSIKCSGHSVIQTI